MRVWWAETDAPEEYEDALLGAFAAGVPADELAELPDRAIVLPFANLRRPTGERRATGLAGSLLPDTRERRCHRLAWWSCPMGTRRGRAASPRSVGRERPTAPTSRDQQPAAPTTAAAPDARLTASGAARMRAELTELTEMRRPEVVARIRAAKELGDLKENADYTAAREEQSFLEGRIQALEARLRDAVIAEVPVVGAGADIGSAVTVEVDGSEITYTLVGSSESDPGAGRLSAASPVGRASWARRPATRSSRSRRRGSGEYRVVSVE